MLISRGTLFRPYLSKDGDQLRLATRVHETGPAFDRERLLTSVREFFVSEMGIAPERVHVTGMFVLAFRSLRVAAIAIGISVDDTIHYVHRLRDEYRESGDYAKAIDRSQESVGRAIYYTTLVIVIGFSLLAFSKFVPTVYFGLLTGLAMAIAMVANLTLLPLLLMKLGAFGR